MKAKLLLLVWIAFASSQAISQGYPNPYVEVGSWIKLPEGREAGAVGDVDIDPNGEDIWVIVRCEGPDNFGSECLNSDLDPILKIDQEGNILESFGGGMFIWPHGLSVDQEGNVWVTDAVRDGRIPEGDKRGHYVVKFSPKGKVLMTLGKPGEQGDGDYEFNSPADVAFDSKGNIYVADGHFVAGKPRIKKFSKDGTFIKSWGTKGSGDGELSCAHAIAIDKRDRVFVADRGNERIVIFDTAGNYINRWTQFGTPSGIFFDKHDRIYVADSESDINQNPGWHLGIRIGDAQNGWVEYYVPLSGGDPRKAGTQGAEFVAVDKYGNMYGGEPRPRMLKKYELIKHH